MPFTDLHKIVIMENKPTKIEMGNPIKNFTLLPLQNQKATVEAMAIHVATIKP
jgi:hypothetical protein